MDTAAKAAAGAKISLEDVKRAFWMGKAGTDPDTILASLRLPDRLFRAEQLWPRALPDSDARQKNAALKWKKASTEELFQGACSVPAEVRAINDHVGWPGPSWDLSGRYQKEFDRLKK